LVGLEEGKNALEVALKILEEIKKNQGIVNEKYL